MSTRCMINFCEGKQIAAKIYRHYDGGDVGEDLELFFDEVEEQCEDTRFYDAEYLAAKFVVWQASKYSKDKNLNFLGLGVSMEDHGDIEYIWFVDCDSKERPKVRVKEE